MIRLIEFLQERASIVRFCLYLTAAIVLIWSLTLDHSHAHTWVEQHIPGFWSIFGFVSCVILVFVSAWLGRAGLAQEEDYYDD